MNATKKPETAAATGLTTLDRCDRCGAQAYWTATLPSGLTLLFCRHHHRAYEPGLVAAGAALHEDSAMMAGLTYDKLVDAGE